MKPLTVFSPAKINLFLAITGRRTDGFHDLISLVAPVNFGDELVLLPTKEAAYSLRCDTAGVPLDASNLVLRAASLFSEAARIEPSVQFKLIKRIPIGAGLGGGSSNGTAALVGLNQLHGLPLTPGQLTEIASKLGSDCVLFLQKIPCVMRGRGECIEQLPTEVVARLRGRRLLLFKPSFGIATAWAYRQMATAAPAHYVATEVAESRLRQWLKEPSSSIEAIAANNMESVAFAKYLALPTLLDALRKRFSVTAGMSGSGSACFAILPDGLAAAPLVETIREAWGEETFVVETQIG